MDYSDFDLEILPGSGEGVYSVSVVHSPAGQAHEIMRFPFNKTEIKDHLNDLQRALLQNQGVHRQILSQEKQSVRDFGQRLFEALFAGEIRSRYDVSLQTVVQQNKGFRLNLRIQVPELAVLPWEYLYDKRPGRYVCFSQQTPIVRYVTLPQPIPSLTVSLPLRILGMTASPTDQAALDIEHEKEQIHNALSNLEKKNLVEVDWMPGQTWRDLQRELRANPDRPYHIFHFIGHGGFDPATDEGAIALVHEKTGKTEMVSATDLGTLLLNHRSLRLVILNACEGARGSEHDIFSSAASILAQQGIPAIVAMQYVITDKAAIELARTLYEAVADGMAIDEAVTEARVAMSMSTLEWGVPVLYMRSHDGKLFDIPQEQRHQQEQRASSFVTPTHSPVDAISPINSTMLPSEPILQGNIPKRGFSRRTVVIGLTGTVAISCGVFALFWNHVFQLPFASNSSTVSPSRPVGTILSTYKGHQERIRALAWSPDSKQIATASDDATARVWDAATAKTNVIYKRHSYYVEGVSWSPDGTRIVSGSADGTAQIWYAKTGEHIYTYHGHRDVYFRDPSAQDRPWVNRVAWSPNGKYIASCDQFSVANHIATVQVWDAKTGKTYTIYQGHTNGVYTVGWSFDSTRVASAGYDGTMQIWNAQTGETLINSIGHKDVFALAWSPDGKQLAFGGVENLVMVIDTTTGQRNLTYDGHTSWIRDLAWCSDGTKIASSSYDHTVHIFHAVTGKLIYSYEKQDGDIAAVGWSPDKTRIASGNELAIVDVWKAP